MKSVMFASLVASAVVSSSAFATGKLVCNSYGKSQKITQQTVVLTPTKLEASDGQTVPYLLEIYKGADVTEETSVKGTVYEEDVSFTFTSTNGDIVFNVFLDEMGESSLTVADKQSKELFICR